MQFLESRQILRASRNDDLPCAIDGKLLCGTVLAHPAITFNAQPRFEGLRRIIHPGMEDSAVPSTRMHACGRLLVDDQDPSTILPLQLSGHRYTHHTRPDD